MQPVVEFCNRSNFVVRQDHMLPRVKKYTIFFNFDQTRHIVCCPHSRLAAPQPNDVISVLAGPLKRRLAALMCIVHPTGCTTQWRRNCGDRGCRGYNVPPQVQDLYPMYPPSQRFGLCQNFKQTTLTTRFYKVRTNLYPPLTKTFRCAWYNRLCSTYLRYY